MIIECKDYDNIPSVYLSLYDRLKNLKSKLNGCILVFKNVVGDSFHFELCNVGRILFHEDGLELIYKDMGTVYLFYSKLVEVALIPKE